MAGMRRKQTDQEQRRAVQVGQGFGGAGAATQAAVCLATA